VVNNFRRRWQRFFCSSQSWKFSVCQYSQKQR